MTSVVSPGFVGSGGNSPAQKYHDASIVSRGIASRWTQRLADGGWTPIATAFLENYNKLDITAVEAMFLIHLFSFKRDTRMPYPSFSTIAEKMGVTVSASRGYARRLEKRGLIRRVVRSGQTSQFDLTPLLEQLEKLVTDGKTLASKEENPF